MKKISTINLLNAVLEIKGVGIETVIEDIPTNTVKVFDVLSEGKDIGPLVITFDPAVEYYLVHQVGNTFNFQKKSYDTERQLKQLENKTEKKQSIWERIMLPVYYRLLSQA